MITAHLRRRGRVLVSLSGREVIVVAVGEGDILESLLPALIALYETQAPDELPAALAAMIRIVHSQIEVADYVGLTVTARRVARPSPLITDHPVVVALDKAERRHTVGPTRDAVRGREIVLVEDLFTEQRWPAFTAEVAATTTVRSIAAVPMYVNQLTIGALTFYADNPGVFGMDSLSPAVHCGKLLALSLGAVVHRHQLEAALESRDLIAQAKGMLRERFSLDDDAAFDLMRQLSQTSNVPVRDIAYGLLQPDPPSDADPPL